MVRISDARMSGTAAGTVVLHVAPESAAGGPLALVEDGDEIEIDVDQGRLALCVSEVELQRRAERRRAARPLVAPASRGYARLFQLNVNQANEGCDFDFLRARPRGSVEL
jgi:dihydroxy-acid dehydratase